MVRRIKRLLGIDKSQLAQELWRKKNRHNTTTVIDLNPATIDRIEVGNFSYGFFKVKMFPGDSKLKIGHFCSIAGDVIFYLNEQHYTNRISTFPFYRMCLEENGNDAFSKGDIIIGDDVWIGDHVKILSGVTIGQGAVVGTGAVVTKNIPPYAICGGVPARVIKYRFSEDIIAELLKKDWGKVTREMVEDHISELQEDLTSVEQIKWMPEKDT